MTAYHGGKQRAGKTISNIIYQKTLESNIEIKGYCEPFCGMLGVYQHIPQLFGDKIKYKAGDLNKSVIMMWKAAQKGWKPPTKPISREQFYKLKNSDHSPLRGFVGSLQSFRGVFFGAYYPYKSTRNKNSSEKVQKIAKELKNVDFKSTSYEKYSNLKNYVIYCDPPYQNTSQFYYENNKRSNLKFNNEEFWKWCKKMAKNNIVFVSEYSAPRPFKKIWSKGKEKLYLIYPS
jgi:DNA adenine methylase